MFWHTKFKDIFTKKRHTNYQYIIGLADIVTEGQTQFHPFFNNFSEGHNKDGMAVYGIVAGFESASFSLGQV